MSVIFAILWLAAGFAGAALTHFAWWVEFESFWGSRTFEIKLYNLLVYALASILGPIGLFISLIVACVCILPNLNRLFGGRTTGLGKTVFSIKTRESRD